MKYNTWNKLINFIIFILISLAWLFGLQYALRVVSDKPQPPVEEIRIDSLKLANDSINKNINRLDSIKYEEIEKVSNLDNDSTLKLFYQLIGK